MKRYILIVVIFLVTLLLAGVLINDNNKMKEIKTVTKQNVMSAKYEDGFIVIEVESESDKSSSIERYDISLVTIRSIDKEKSYVKKYFNGYKKLISIELFCNKSVFSRI